MELFPIKMLDKLNPDIICLQEFANLGGNYEKPMFKNLWVGCLLLVACETSPVGPNLPVARAAVSNSVSTYIVRFSDTEPDVNGKVSSILKQYNATKQVFVYKNTIKGMAIQTNDSIINLIKEVDGVISVEEDAQVTINQSWGLDRIDQRNLPLDLSYTYPNQGNNVVAYILDTGIDATNSEFTNRLLVGKNFADTTTSTQDCNGHGTHVAGITGGTTFGVAKQIKLVPVRVLGCNGSGTWSAVIAGIDWTAGNFTKPAVMNASIGGGYNQSVNAAITNAVAKGLAAVSKIVKPQAITNNAIKK
jgi:subtilisin family serine protease